MVEQQISEQATLAVRTEFTRRLRDARTTEARVDALRPYLHLAGWHESVIAVLRDCGDEAGRALYLLTLDPQRQSSAYEDLLHRDLIFALQAINAGIKLDQPGKAMLIGELLPALFATARDRRKPKFKVADKIIKALAQLDDAALQSRIAAALIPYTKDPDRDVRRIAAFGLGWLRAQDEASIDALLTMLREDEDRFNRAQAAQVLSDQRDLPEVIAALRERLHGEADSDVMMTLAPVLAEAGFADEAINELVARIHKEQDGFYDKCAVYALNNALRASGAARPDLVEMLLDLLRNNKSGGVRFAVAGTLADTANSSDRVIDALFYALEHDQDPAVHAPVIDTLLTLRPNDHSIIKRLIDLQINCGRGSGGWPLTDRLASMNITDADIAQMLDALGSGDWDTKSNAVALLEELAMKLTEANVERLIVALDSDDWEVVNSVGQVLQSLAKPNSKWRTMLAQKVLTNQHLQDWLFSEIADLLPPDSAIVKAQIGTWVSQLLSEDASKRRIATHELLKLPTLDETVITALTEQLRHSDEFFQAIIVTGLARHAHIHPGIVTLLVEQLGDDVPLRLRIAAARGLGEIGSRDPAVVAALFAALEQDEPNLSVAAAAALLGLGQHRPAAERVLHQIASTKHKWSVFGIAEDEAFKLLYELVVGEDEDEEDVQGKG